MSNKLPSEPMSPAEAIAAIKRVMKEDARILAVYQTITNDYMIAARACELYCILFASKDRARVLHMVMTEADKSAKSEAAHIAQMIGATLIEEVQA